MSTKSNSRANRKKPIGFGIFCEVILFIILLIGLICTICTWIEPIYNFFIGMAPGFLPRIARILDSKLIGALGLANYPNVEWLQAQDATWASLAVSSILIVVIGVVLVFSYLPWMVIGHNRLKDKSGKTWRTIVEIINWVIVFAYIFYGLSLALSTWSVTASAFAWAATLRETMGTWVESFQLPWGGAEFSGILYLGAIVAIIDIVLCIVGMVGGKKKPKAVADKYVENVIKPIPAAEVSSDEPIAVVEDKSEEGVTSVRIEEPEPEAEPEPEPAAEEAAPVEEEPEPEPEEAASEAEHDEEPEEA